MGSKTVTLRWYNAGYNRDMTIYFSETYNVSTNKTSVKITALEFDGGLSGRLYGNIKINGTTALNIQRNVSGYVDVSSDESHSPTATYVTNNAVTVSHNADGTGSFTFTFGQYASGYTNFYVDGGGGKYIIYDGRYDEVSVSVGLTTRPRASAPSASASNVTMGNSVTINTNRASSSFTHTIKYAFGSSGGQIASGVGASTSWTPPVSLANQIADSTSGTCVITCDTYSGSTLIGSKTCSLILSVPSSVVPTIGSCNAALDNSANSTINGWGIAVVGYTKVKLTASASGAYGSTISRFEVTGKYTVNQTAASLNYTSSVLTSSGENQFTIVAVDSRGRKSSAVTKKITAYDYAKPTVSSFAISRMTGTNAGKMSAKVIWSISSVNNKNSATGSVNYKKPADKNFARVCSINNNTQTTVSITNGFVEASSYNFKVVVTDAIGNSAEAISFIPSAAAFMDWKAGGKGLGLGKRAESDRLEIGFDTKFYGTVGGVDASGREYSFARGGFGYGGESSGLGLNGTFDSESALNAKLNEIGATMNNCSTKQFYTDLYPFFSGTTWSCRLHKTDDNWQIFEAMSYGTSERIHKIKWNGTWQAIQRSGLSAYPVGGIYISTVSTSPASLFGGTWEQIQGRFLLAAGGGYNAGSTGGEANHTLTVNEMPSHTHGVLQANNNGKSGTWVTNASTTNALKVDYGWTATYTGGGAAHNNMPPYLAVYVWKRTA